MPDTIYQTRLKAMTAASTVPLITAAITYNAMLNFTSKIIQMPPTAEKIYKNIQFGTAVGLTKTAKEGQAGVISALQSKFTIRGQWFKQNTPVGIKVKPATRDSQRAEIWTAAPFLPRHEDGSVKLPYKNWLAIPTENVRKSKAAKIPANLRPNRLQNAFVIVTKGGTRLLCVRKGRGKNRSVTVMYILVRRAKINKAEIWDQPIRSVIARRLDDNIADGIDKALKTMR